MEHGEAEKKIRLYRERAELEKSVRRAPPNTGDFLQGVNVFSETQQEVTPQDPLGPFICKKDLTFNDCELKVLSRGPKFMVRADPIREEFDVEIENMIVKKKLDTAFSDEEDIPQGIEMNTDAQPYQFTHYVS